MTAERSNPAAPTVLVLDDDPDMADLLGLIATRAGFRAVVTTTFDAFRREHARRPDVVILDLVMPGTDGVEVIRYMAARRSESALMLVSSVTPRVLAAAERLAAAQGLNVIGAVRKPIVPEEVASALAERHTEGRETTRLASVLISPDDLRRGIEADELTVFFQPKIEVQSLRFVAVEALARWRHPEHGLIGPHAFIDLAEQTDQMNALTETIIEKALSQCADWARDGMPLKISVNVSTRCLSDLSLPERLETIAARYGTDPADVVIEITESWIGQDAIAALDILTRLRMKGFDLSIDDFGTGYSTMLKLKQIPFSELKLDQSFIRDAARDAESRTIVESSISLGQRLGLHVVAEGIERQEDWDLISDLGCDEGQGYFIARPMAGAEVPGWLGHWNRSLGIA